MIRGGSNINIDAQGDISIGNDLIGRDKIIQNIVIVGHLLEFAKARDLLSDIENHDRFERIEEVIKFVFEKWENEAQALDFVGNVLSDLIHSWTPIDQYASFPYRQFAVQLSHHLVNKLKELGYWNEYCERKYIIKVDQKTVKLDSDVFPLKAVRRIWYEYKNYDCFWGIAEYKDPSLMGLGSISDKFVRGTSDENLKVVEIVGSEEFNSENLRLVIVGIIFDLVNLAIQTQSDFEFLSKVTRILRRPLVTKGELNDL